ncbi:hypothetical protein PZB75_11315 [Streptomyces sp. AM 4-1-1]|uniref:hypothetical protein n=1 Tax=Streptomyces sp. AM 4-1-1 TaxID=3028710 RepID=UPI0023B99BF5|nr:hypothetical protein [Streptomyces sp. AM 4-1-1]WEH33908.1 hypothetical protein PZB75_11315 [Streptomyces sp. AM 4-1-1]
MTDNDTSRSPSGTTAPEIPYAGTASTAEAVAAVKEVSSRLHDFMGVPGEASAPGPGVRECEGKDPDTYFRVHHPWNFLPTSGADNDTAMANLKKKLSTGGWVVKDSYRDNSANKNLNLIADNDARKVSVWVVAYSGRATPSIGIDVTSGCYRVPEGQTVEHS